MRKCTENDICLRHADWLREYTASLRPPMRRDDAYSTALYALLHAIRTAGPADDFRPYAARCVRLFLKIECDRERRSRRCERYNASLDRRVRADGAALFQHFRRTEAPRPPPHSNARISFPPSPRRNANLWKTCMRAARRKN